MFSPSPAPLHFGPLEALHVSLNAPVVDVEELPVGPAHAAIALHARAGEAAHLTIAVRSLGTGQVAFYRSDSDLAGLGSGAAVDAALTFAEGLGFLFDTDELTAPGGGERAGERWLEIAGESAMVRAATHQAAVASDVALTRFRPGAPRLGRLLADAGGGRRDAVPCPAPINPVRTEFTPPPPGLAVGPAMDGGASGPRKLFQRLLGRF